VITSSAQRSRNVRIEFGLEVEPGSAITLRVTGEASHTVRFEGAGVPLRFDVAVAAGTTELVLEIAAEGGPPEPNSSTLWIANPKLTEIALLDLAPEEGR
jgi:hypothetical protein